MTLRNKIDVKLPPLPIFNIRGGGYSSSPPLYFPLPKMQTDGQTSLDCEKMCKVLYSKCLKAICKIRYNMSQGEM